MAEKLLSIINVNTNKKIRFYTQGQQLAARVVFTLWLLASSSPEGVFAAPGRHRAIAANTPTANAVEELISQADVLDNHTFGQALNTTLQIHLPSDVSLKTVLTNLRAIALTLLAQGTDQISDDQVLAIEGITLSPEILVETGLLQATDSGKYQFAHPRIQAYLAGRALTEKLLSQDEHEQSSVRILLSKDKYNPQYRTALSFMAREVSMVRGIQGIQQLLKLLGEDKEVVGLQHLLLQLRVLHEWLCIAYDQEDMVELESEFKVISSLQEWFCAGLEQVRLWGHGPASPGVRILDLLTDSLQVSSSVLHHNSGLLYLLHKATEDRDSKVRQAVLRTLEQFILRIPQTSENILPILQEAAKSQNSDVRQAAVKTLGKAISVVSQKEAILETLYTAAKEDARHSVSQAAVKALGKAISVVPQASEEILKTLYNVTIKTRYCSVRQAAFEALIEALSAVPEKSEKILTTLCKNAQDQDFSLRKTAVKALGKVISSIPQEEAILEILLSAINDPHLEVRQAAVKALGKAILAIPQNPVILPTLFKAAKDKQYSVRQAAIEALGGAILVVPEELKTMLDTLREATKDAHFDVSKEAVKALEKAILAAPLNWVRFMLNILYQAANTPNCGARQQAVTALGKAISVAPKALRGNILEILCKAAKDRQDSVRQAAIEALGEAILVVPEPLKTMLNILYNAAKHQDWDVREEAVKALGKAISVAPQALMGDILKTLYKAASHQDWNVRKAAVAALGKAILVAPQELMEAILKTLRTAAQDTGYLVREAAVAALGKAISVAPQELMEAILETLQIATQDQNGYVREAAVQALGKFNSLDTIFLTILIKSTKDQDKNVYQAAAQALAKFPTEHYIDSYWVTKDPQLVFYIAYRLHETSLVITQSQATLYPAGRIWQRPTEDLEHLARLIKYEIDPVKQGVKYQADKGPEYYHQCLQRAQAFQLGNHPDLVLMLQNLSAAYQNSGNTTYAIQYHQQAAQLRQKLEVPTEAKS